VTVVFGFWFVLYVLLGRAPAAVVAGMGSDNPAVQQGDGPPVDATPPAKGKLKTDIHPQEEPPVQPGAPQPGLPATNVPGDIFAHIDCEVKANRVKHEEKGWTLFKRIRDMPAEPSILIGFNVLKKKGPFDELVAGLQPIYLTRTGEKTGPWLGNFSTTPIVLKAKPGYIVGALHIKTATTFDAFAVTFVRFEAGRIVASDNYASPWVGGTSGNTATARHNGARATRATRGRATAAVWRAWIASPKDPRELEAAC
jgi:hypothetical protein